MYGDGRSKKNWQSTSATLGSIELPLKPRYSTQVVLSCGESAGGGGRRLAKRYVGLYTGPYFDPSAPNNITTQLGTHAYLPCKVRQLSNKSVSWIRRRDAHILTVDRYTFIADERFQAFLVEATDTWTLQVKYVQARDAGVYECQVGTEPKMSHFVQLNVVVPKIEISGESDLFVKAGSTVALKCVITQALEEPAYIFWYHDGRRVLDYDRRQVDIRTERVSADTTLGSLLIRSARREDSGNYSCSPSNLDSASVMLHVLSGEQPAAMQHGNGAGAGARGGGPSVWWRLLLAVLVALTPLSLWRPASYRSTTPPHAPRTPRVPQTHRVVPPALPSLWLWTMLSLVLLPMLYKLVTRLSNLHMNWVVVWSALEIGTEISQSSVENSGWRGRNGMRAPPLK
ncbi:Zwei Ig domain protein zig-8 [Eumeta japonica]|uniref:Zwei Ig domain protein zig-8 n=1 Tax=Eumeta variegata TaxID=151549 RepID=A0A4C1WRQ9_EUMVA|nr:Zwei Ig domain protein zig-8 [Eumeta japonica]